MAVSPSTHLPATPNAHPVTAGHLGNGAEAAGAANEAVQPPDASADAATTLPPPPPSPDTIPVASEAMATSSTAIPTAFQPRGGVNVMVPASMGPSHHVEEVVTPSQLPREKRNTSDIECPSISNCNAEEGDERGTTEGVDNMPSEARVGKKDTTEVSCVPFHPFN